MRPEDKTDFARILAGMAATHRVELSKDVYLIWWNAMSDWTLDEFRSAASHLIKTCQFMPKPYDFEQLRRAHDTTADEAWLIALGHASAGKRSPIGEERIDNAVDVIGGYHTIGMTDLTKMAFVERRFCEAYENFRDVDDSRQALPNYSTTKRLGRSASLKAIAESIAEDDPR